MNMITPQMFLGALLRQEFASFVRKCFAEVSASDQLSWNWHLDALIHKLMEVKAGTCTRLIVNVPPRSLKSITVSVAYVAWLLGHNPKLKFICVSYASELAEELGRQCLKIMQSVWYRQLFPNTRTDRKKCSAGHIVTTRGGFRLATSIDGSLTGFGADIIVIDDPIKADAGLSEAERNRVSRWYDGTLSTRLNDKARGRIVLVMQRLHMEDLTAHVQEKETWDQLVLPAIAQQDILVPLGPSKTRLFKAHSILHSSREDGAVLERIKRVMGTHQFSAQYLQEPAPMTGNLVKRDWFKAYAFEPARENGDDVVISWDTASKASELADYSVATVWQIKRLSEGCRYYLLDVYRQRVEFPDLKRAVSTLAAKWKSSTVLIEDKSSGQALIQQLQSEGFGCVPIKVEDDKIMRFVPQAAVIEQGRVFLPDKAIWLDDFCKELMQFPGGKHDDQVDSVSQFLKWAETRAAPRQFW